MTRLLFIRHAESDYNIKDDFSRPLTESGSRASRAIPQFFADSHFNYFYSSPFVRVVNTIKYFADQRQIENGESLREVQERNISEVKKILSNHQNQNIVIGTHGTALCTILNYYNDIIDFAYFQSIAKRMPLFLELHFDNFSFIGMKELHRDALANQLF